MKIKESELKRVIRETISKCLNEEMDPDVQRYHKVMRLKQLRASGDVNSDEYKRLEQELGGYPFRCKPDRSV